ncbi:unnamed protein product [Blepharisma stoltei]|uniref:Uncharacterized protein n=1 Tax=Blepharisma stoltei TaxID=1481888 RepID=A0AAU9J7L5_9CILI|nr:unnamed protein product [Blepharisma stoltei]
MAFFPTSTISCVLNPSDLHAFHIKSGLILVKNFPSPSCRSAYFLINHSSPLSCKSFSFSSSTISSSLWLLMKSCLALSSSIWKKSWTFSFFTMSFLITFSKTSTSLEFSIIFFRNFGTWPFASDFPKCCSAISNS